MTPSEFANHAAEIAGLKATVQAQSREIRDLKRVAKELADTHASTVSDLAGKLDTLTLQIQPLILSAEKINDLLTEADRQDGMKALAKTLVGGGFLAAIGAALMGIFHYFRG